MSDDNQKPANPDMYESHVQLHDRMPALERENLELKKWLSRLLESEQLYAACREKYDNGVMPMLVDIPADELLQPEQGEEK